MTRSELLTDRAVISTAFLSTPVFVARSDKTGEEGTSSSPGRLRSAADREMGEGLVLGPWWLPVDPERAVITRTTFLCEQVALMADVDCMRPGACVESPQDVQHVRLDGF